MASTVTHITFVLVLSPLLFTNGLDETRGKHHAIHKRLSYFKELESVFTRGKMINGTWWWKFLRVMSFSCKTNKWCGKTKTNIAREILREREREKGNAQFISLNERFVLYHVVYFITVGGVSLKYVPRTQLLSAVHLEILRIGNSCFSSSFKLVTCWVTT